MPTSEIRELTNRFVEQLLPVRIYLFGSYADSTWERKSCGEIARRQLFLTPDTCGDSHEIMFLL